MHHMTFCTSFHINLVVHYLSVNIYVLVKFCIGSFFHIVIGRFSIQINSSNGSKCGNYCKHSLPKKWREYEPILTDIRNLYSKYDTLCLLAHSFILISQTQQCMALSPFWLKLHDTFNYNLKSSTSQAAPGCGSLLYLQFCSQQEILRLLRVEISYINGITGAHWCIGDSEQGNYLQVRHPL